MPKGVPNKRYTPEFKKLVIETMQEEKLSYSETCRRFEVNSRDRIKSWERIYLEEGPEGFAVERRGRSSKGRLPKRLPKEVTEDLLAEVQHPVRICISEKFHDLIKLFFPFDKICEIHISEVSKGDAGQAIGLSDLFQSGIQCGKRLDFSIWTKAQGAFFGQSGIFQNNALIQISPVPDLIK